jgi:hypothetical protein
VDSIVLDATASQPVEQPKFKAAIACPPTIYDGTETSSVRQRSVQIPTLAKTPLHSEKALTVLQVQNEWRNIHAPDLADG